MRISTAHLKGISSYSFRPGKLGKIIGVVMVKPRGNKYPVRPCFQVEYPDGHLDQVPVEEYPGEVDIVSLVPEMQAIKKEKG